MSRLRVVPRRLIDEGEWNAFCDDHDTAWWWHRTEWLDYCLAYGNDPSDDKSFGVYESACLVGVCPLLLNLLTCRTEGGGSPCAFPILENGTGATVYDEVERCLNGIGNEVTPVWYIARTCPLTMGNLVPVDSTWWGNEVRWTQIIDLAQSEQQLWHDVRKSYRPLINKQRREMGTSDFTTESLTIDIAIRDMKELHKTQAGKVTRSDATWAMMGDWLKQKNACCVMVHRDTTCIGFAYAIIYKDCAYYASGATDGTCGHVIQWQLIVELKRLGVTKYEIGWQEEATDMKGLNIEFFKRGFGGKSHVFFFITRAY